MHMACFGRVAIRMSYVSMKNMAARLRFEKMHLKKTQALPFGNLKPK